MYKVFVNEKPIIVTSDNNFLTNLRKEAFSLPTLDNWLNQLFFSDIEGICFISNTLQADWNDFKNYFTIQKAAGGKVVNTNKEVLFIYRLGKWDLPKGKLEVNETLENCAIREVEEECGVNGLTIKKQLPTTYHIFKYKKKLIFKITYWFLMTTAYSGKLVPQLEEGITDVKFLNTLEQQKALKNTYKNIKILF